VKSSRIETNSGTGK